jgi:hypothetical protein
MDGYVHINDLMTHLQSHGLVITRRELVMSDEQLEREILLRDQKRVLKKRWLSYKEIIDNKLLGYSSRTGLITALKKRSDFDQVVKEVNGITKVFTSTIKQLRDES